MKNSYLVHASIILVFLGGLFAGVPEDKKTITIDRLDGGKGAATFEHEKHATKYKKEDGTQISCMDCHHEAKAEEDIKKGCDECHVAEGQEQKEVNGKKAPFFGVKVNEKYKTSGVLMHGLCLECHKKVKVDSEGKKITSCKQCHQ